MAETQSLASSIKVTLDGMMVLHQDRRQGDYEVGILGRVERHSFKISVRPDPRTGHGELRLRREEIERFKQLGNTWALEVVDARTGAPRKGISAVADAPLSRHDPNSDLQELGWAIDLESGEFHGRVLDLRPGLLMPILRLSNGRLYTACKTDGVDLLQPQHEPRRFGYVAETVALGIDMRPGEELVLRVNDAGEEGVIFRIPYNPEFPYRVSLRNTADGQHGEETSHFRYYYDLFTDVPEPERFGLQLTKPTDESPNPCVSMRPSEHGNHGGKEIRTVNPYLCGGILLGTREEPLA